MKQRVFIGSSSEKIKIARAISADLSSDHEPTVWDGGIFDLSKDILSGLIERLEKSDAAVFVLAPDDVTQLRNAAFKTARDNVIFELGMFIGRLGRERTYFIIPRGDSKLRLPTDLLGIVAATYDAGRSDENWSAAVAPACDQIRQALRKSGLTVDSQHSPESQAVTDGRTWMHDYVNKTLRIVLTTGNSPPSTGIRSLRDRFETSLGRTTLCIRFGRIESCEGTEPGCVVALPANDLFDDECIDDPKSALGAYIQCSFQSRLDEIKRLVSEKLAGAESKMVESSRSRFDRSFGIAKAIYFANPLSSGRKLIFVSISTKRAGLGVRSEASFLFAAMKAICREMNDHKLTELHLPVFTSGCAGLEAELALLYLILAVRAVVEDRSLGTHLRSVCIVVFQKDNKSEPNIPRDVVGRILALGRASL